MRLFGLAALGDDDLTLGEREYGELARVDIKWLFAAYRKGSFDLPKGLDAKQFSVEAAKILSEMDEAYLLMSDKPVGIVLSDVRNHLMEPHVIWFKWATPRNIYESSIHFINEIRKSYVMLFFTRKDADRSFWEATLKHGILKRVGKIEGYYENGDSMLYQSKSGRR